MANPYSGIAAQILQAYQNQANTLGGYAQGFSGNLQSLANSESESAMALLEQMGAPESQQQQVGDQAGGPVGDTLYGQTGYLPAEALGEQGNAFAAYAATLPGLLQQELQQNAAYFAAMHPPPSYSGGGGGGGGGGGSSSDGGDSGGLTPSQQLAIAKFEYDKEQDAMRWEFEMAKWEHELKQDDRAAKKEARAFKQAMALVGFNMGNTKADNARANRAQRQRERQDRINNQQENARIEQAQQRIDNAAVNAANVAASRRGAAAQEYWGSLGKGARDIFDDQFPRSTSSGGTTTSVAPGGGGGGAPTSKLPEYKVAFRRVMAGMRAQFTKPNGQWKYGFTNKQIKAKVNQVLRSKGVKVPNKKKPKPRKPPPRRGGRPAGYWK